MTKVNRQNLTLCWQAITDFAKKSNSCTLPQRTTSVISEYEEEPFDVITSNVIADTNSYSHPVSVHDFEDYVKRSIANQVLETQYKVRDDVVILEQNRISKKKTFYVTRWFQEDPLRILDVDHCPKIN